MVERHPEGDAVDPNAQEGDVHSLTRMNFGPSIIGAKADGAAARASDAPSGWADALGVQRLYAAHHADVLRAAQRITGSLEDAEDVVQTVFLRLMRAGGGGDPARSSGVEPAGRGADPGGGIVRSLEDVRNPGGYLRRSAINAALDLVRARARRPQIALDQTRELDDEAAARTSDGRDVGDGDKDLRTSLRRAVAALHPSTAEIFALRYFEEFTNRQIADMLGVSESSIGVSLHRARTQLKRALADVAGG